MKNVTGQWLSLLCVTVEGAVQAAVYSVDKGTLSAGPSAVWPDPSRAGEDLLMAGEAAFSQKKSVSWQQEKNREDTGEPRGIIACPLVSGDLIYGVVVVQIAGRAPGRQETVLKQVQSATLWLDALIRQAREAQTGPLVTLVELVASCIEHKQFSQAATEVVTILAAHFSCDRVSIGFSEKNRVRVAAISHSSDVDSGSNLVHDIGEAMLEAMEQNSLVSYPPLSEADLQLTRSHEVLVQRHGNRAVLSVPFVVQGELAGVVLLEKSEKEGFDEQTRDQITQIAAMIGPVLYLRCKEEQPLLKKAGLAINAFLSSLLGREFIGVKLSLAAFLLAVLILSLVTGEYRITCSGRLDAEIQQMVVAPQNGYLAEATVRPGDIVHMGDLLGRLDDKDLRLKSGKWSSQLNQFQREYREALAQHDRSKVRIIRARMEKAKAQLNLVRKQLERSRFTAPFNGVVVSGDFSQQLGSPVERGQVLFTVAPLDSYRIILKVDERDIGAVKTGQQGTLVLAGMTDKPLPFSVVKVTPVSVVEQGRNYFRVEADLAGDTDLLRPGMEGIAKIFVDRRKLIWIWGHGLLDWFRITLWRIGP